MTVAIWITVCVIGYTVIGFVASTVASALRVVGKTKYDINRTELDCVLWFFVWPIAGVVALCVALGSVPNLMRPAGCYLKQMFDRITHTPVKLGERIGRRYS